MVYDARAHHITAGGDASMPEIALGPGSCKPTVNTVANKSNDEISPRLIGAVAFAVWSMMPERNDGWLSKWGGSEPQDSDLIGIIDRDHIDGGVDRMAKTLEDALMVDPVVEEGLKWWLFKRAQDRPGACVESMAEAMLASSRTSGIPSDAILKLAPLATLEDRYPELAYRLAAMVLAKTVPPRAKG